MAFWPFKSAIEKHVDSAIEEKIFEQVAREMHANTIRPGLWAKAFAECNGDPDRTNARYIILRAASITNEIAAEHELLSKAATQQCNAPEVESNTSEVRSNSPVVFCTLVCPSCWIKFRFRDLGKFECRCPNCKTGFHVDSSNKIND